MLRRAILILATMSLGVLMLSGVALARDIRGTFGPDVLPGTDQADQIYGLGGKDTITGRAGNDDCYGGNGPDTIRCGLGNDRIDGGFGLDDLFGGPGDDRISAADGQMDRVSCGQGTDTAYVDELDFVVDNPISRCENVFLAERVPGGGPV
jgi:Ca2+-binding RTX toxin-like protein